MDLRLPALRRGADRDQEPDRAPANVLRFTGEVLDPTGLYQLRARSYDPLTGRFLSTDPAAAGPTDPSVSAYAYVNGNPIRYTDPSGRCVGPLIFLLPACVGAAVGAALGVGSYIVSTVGTNVVGNVIQDRGPSYDVLRGLNPVDAAISGAAGVLGGPLGGIAYGPTRVLAGAALGCSATFAPQAAGGRTGDLVETGIGCVAGGAGSVLKVGSKVGSFIYGSVVALAQALATYAEQQLRAGTSVVGGGGK